MPEPIQYEDNELFNPETQHEHSDVPVRPLFWFIALFIVFGVLSHFTLYFLYNAFVKSERSRMEAPQTQVARPADAYVPQNQPLLQPFPHPGVAPQRQTPVTDLADMRCAEDQVLKNYGWVDRQHGVVHIPIEEAKRLYAAKAAVEGHLRAPLAGATQHSAPSTQHSAPTATVPPATATPGPGGSQ